MFDPCQSVKVSTKFGQEQTNNLSYKLLLSNGCLFEAGFFNMAVTNLSCGEAIVFCQLLELGIIDGIHFVPVAIGKVMWRIREMNLG